MTMSAADFLDQWFETAPLKATMSASGIIGTYQGVRSPGTAYVLLHHYMGEIDGAFRAWGIPRGGTGGVSEAIASSARSFGAEIRTEAPVAHITVRDGRATGVVLESGEEIGASAVLASTDAKVTFLDLLEPGTLEPRLRGVHPPVPLPGLLGQGQPGARRPARLHGHARSRRAPAGRHQLLALAGLHGAGIRRREGRPTSVARPYVDMVIPTLVDPRMAPPGKHIVSCFVQYAPYKLAEGTWDDQREAFGDAVVDTLAERAPNIRSLILHRQVLTPLDIERTMGLTEGNIFQGELSLEQLFVNRPAPGWARFRTPVKDLWLCGSSAHPGGGIMGAPGASRHSSCCARRRGAAA